MIDLVRKVSDAFEQQFDGNPTHYVQAPGRVNLIGEHTDYNDGFVLPCAIDFQTVVACRKRNDGTVSVYAVDFDELDSFTVAETIEKSDKLWANYIRGVVQFLRQRGFEFSGADIAITGNVPLGAGLSSSAALEVVIGQTFKTLYDLNISQADIALNGQQAENDYVGMNCGIMDQLISAKGEAGKALLIDCRDLTTQAIDMPDDFAVMIVNSNKKHSLVDGEYNTRRAQCEAAAASLGIKALRDATMDHVNHSSIDKNSDIYKRARHVISENARTLAMAEALKSGDSQQMSTLMAQSHASMRDDFEITIPEIDYLVAIISEVLGEQGGVRMTGGGFGGSVVALVPHDIVPQVCKVVTDNYQAQTGIKETIYRCKPSAGAGIIQ